MMASLARLSIVGETVVVDALNYLGTFVPIDEPSFKNATVPRLFMEMERRVRDRADLSTG